MQGNRSALTRVESRRSAWYQCSARTGTAYQVEMKSTTSCVTSTMYSLAPILLNGGTVLGSSLLLS
jgi:hypothetical protein